MLSKTYGSAVYGVEARIITLEVTVAQGLGFYMVGLADSAVKESQQRVEASLKFAGYRMPRQKIVVNLVPADLRKEGTSYDLSIALCVLESSEQIKPIRQLQDYIIMGELSLDGVLRPIKGVLPIAIEARKNGFKGFILPAENAHEAAIVNELDVIPVKTLEEAIAFLEGKMEIEPLVVDTQDLFYTTQNNYEADFSHVQGQENIKRAL
ncbi:MAG: magnesium chelatase domain-containing protein, partial [Spirosomataceae bacterium]